MLHDADVVLTAQPNFPNFVSVSYNQTPIVIYEVIYIRVRLQSHQ